MEFLLKFIVIKVAVRGQYFVTLVLHLRDQAVLEHALKYTWEFLVGEIQYALDPLKTLSKEQKTNWPLYVPSLVHVHYAMPHRVSAYQPFDLYVILGWG